MADFGWDRFGDISAGRQKLGANMPVLVYRLMQYTLKDAMLETMGAEKADELFRAAGWKAGHAFAKNLLNLNVDFDAFVAEMESKLKEYGIGLMRVETSDIENLTMTLSIAEDLDCSGLPVTGNVVCVYDEGFIAGILNAYTGKTFSVVEVDCWATGDRTCRFDVKPIL